MKKIITLAFALVVCFMLVGCDNKENSNTDQGSLSEIAVGRYKVEKKNNSVLVITNDGSNISTTEYVFSGNGITKAVLTQAFSTTEMAQLIYNQMKSEPTIMAQYSDVKLNGKKIEYTISNELISIYSSYNQDTFYELMRDTYSAYIDN